MDVPKILHRQNILEDYVVSQATFISRTKGLPYDNVYKKVKAMVKDKYKPKRLAVSETVSPGNIETKQMDLLKFIGVNKDKIISPSGSTYYRKDEKASVFSQFILDELADRKKIKDIQFEAAEAGDKVKEMWALCGQASVKIRCNSGPGGFASPYNFLYDKGGYNTITSTARTVIARAYTMAEQLLGGNFAWFTVDELINHIILCLEEMEVDKVKKAIKKYKLKEVNKEDLAQFYYNTLAKYTDPNSIQSALGLIESCDTLQIQYLYYYCNLRHIIIENSKIFRPFLNSIKDVSKVNTNYKPSKDEFNSIDETIMAIVTVVYTKELGGNSLKKIKSEAKQYIPALYAYAKHVENKLSSMQELFDAFVYTKYDVPLAHKKPFTRRNTTIISDTDSVLFTAAQWDDWYRRGAEGLDDDSFFITSLVIYWLHHSVAHALFRVSVNLGLIDEDRYRIRMKNEFLYLALILYNTKKTYIGLQMVQEGIIYPKPKMDIKGQTLRGSSINQDALNFASDLVEEILHGVAKGKQKVSDIITKVINYEYKIINSVRAGETDYLKITSLKTYDQYKNPSSTAACKAHGFWEAVFAKKYGTINAPIKVRHFKALKVSEAYFDKLKKTSPSIYKAFKAYLKEHNNKIPNSFMVNPQYDAIPKELIDLVDIRDIVHTTLVPVYSSLERLNIAVGNSNDKKLLSDIYH